jgi:hypothetical protein
MKVFYIQTKTVATDDPLRLRLSALVLLVLGAHHQGVDHGARSPQLLSLTIMKKNGSSLKSWWSEQASFQCDPLNI